MRTQLERHRTIGIVAHVDAGKTTLTERILFYTGAIHAPGEVHLGTATTDSSPEEQQHGITISSAATTVAWRDHVVTLIDTPGHVDFSAEVTRSLRVLDGAVVVFDGVAGVEPQSEAVWRLADRHAVPRICFVNKLDRPGADFAAVVADVARTLGAVALPVVLPVGHEEGFRGLIDLVTLTATTWPDGTDDLGTNPETGPVPHELAGAATAARAELVERLAEHDEPLLAAWLEHKEVDAMTLRAALRRATVAGAVVPVLGGSAFRNRGVQPLLDAVVDYLPSPAERAEVDPSGPLAALVFKVETDPHVGRLAWVRVYSGAVAAKDAVAVVGASGTSRQRVARVLRMQAARREDLDVAGPGEIVALTGLRGASTGDTVCAPSAPVALEAMAFPEPVVSVVVEARSRADAQRLAETLARLTAEDPTLRVRTHPETGQTLLSGMGELHLQVRLDRMAREFGLHVGVGAPQVALRETVRRAAVHRYRLKRQRGGAGQFAEVELSLEPTGRFQDADGPTVEFVDEVRGGTVPSEFIPAVEAGVRAAAAEGALAGYPVVGVRVALRDGAFHDKDSSAMAFQAAGAQGFKAAARAAGLVLLEPIADVEVTTPAVHVGDVIADLSRRRGRVGALEAQRGATVVRAQVPLAELFGYADDLRSLSHGRATFTQRHGTYAEAPG